ncbi:hypothetical protein OIU14_13260 [Thalassobacter stenotrophicus]|uniref:hypothetical protein n=1 Tax=Thalassobacter stenotrophicus TaxID=266809 RepID=UPI0022A9E98C|nr:hypothetical protein [Thalassobacter stenotrophicus]UYP67437.1 hypothetical protein OIU14_13260 [Thalassobacter stenotrophicus]
MTLSIPFHKRRARDSARADWTEERRREARAVVADVVHHSDHLIRLACNVLALHGDTEEEREDARNLLAVVDGWQLGRACHRPDPEVAP